MDPRTVLGILFSLLCVKYTFFWCYGRFGFEGNNKYAEKILHQPLIALTMQLSVSVTDKILFTLQVYFARNVFL